MLVDTGGLPGSRFDIGARVVAPFLLHEWVGSLDVLVLTHAQADHIGGAPAILRSFPVGEVWTGDTLYSSVTFLWVQEYLRHRRIPLRILSADSPEIRWGEATIQVLHPPPRGSRPARGAPVTSRGLKPWREVVRPHPDVASGNFRNAENLIAELARRLAEDDANPNDAVSWETIRTEAMARWNTSKQ